MKKSLLLMSLLSLGASADVLGGEVEVGYYNHTPSGTASYQGSTIDVQDDLKWSKESDAFAKLYIEHPIPVLPNIKLGYTDFSHIGSGTVGQAFTFSNQTFNVNSDIQTDFNLKMYDVGLYYEILDNWVNLDVGLNVKFIEGSLSVASNLVPEERSDFSAPLPMLYAKARFDVPATDLSFLVEGNYVEYEGNRFYDAEIGARYTFALGLGVEAGYKTMSLKLDNVDDVSMDTQFSGAYGKIVWDF